MKLYYLHQQSNCLLSFWKIALIGNKNLDSSDWSIQKIPTEMIQRLF